MAARIASGPGFWTGWPAEPGRQGLLEELLAGDVIARALREVPPGRVQVLDHQDDRRGRAQALYQRQRPLHRAKDGRRAKCGSAEYGDTEHALLDHRKRRPLSRLRRCPGEHPAARRYDARETRAQQR
jgi:hypothetical protein